MCTPQKTFATRLLGEYQVVTQGIGHVTTMKNDLYTRRKTFANRLLGEYDVAISHRE